jgi:putative transposase
MKDRDKAEAIATERMQLIAPLLGDHVDAALARELKATMSAQSGLSERTIRRYVTWYQAEGFRGLLPSSRTNDPPPSGAIAPDILEQAIQLRREAPHRSVRQIIQVLEWEGRVAPVRLSGAPYKTS